MVGCSRAGDGKDGVYEVGISCDEVMEVPFGVVSSGWYWCVG